MFFSDVNKVYASFTNVCNPFEVDRLITLHNGKIMSDEIKECLSSLVTNLAGIIQGLIIPDCSHYEADTRIIIHVLNCLQNSVVDVFVKTNDTDIIVLLTVYLPKFLEYGGVNIVAFCGVGNNSHYLSINKIGNFIGLQRVQNYYFCIQLVGATTPLGFLK